MPLETALSYFTGPNDPSQGNNTLNARLQSNSSKTFGGYAYFAAPIAAELVSIVNAVTPTNVALTLAAQPDYPRKLQVRVVIGTTTTTAITAGNLAIIGTNAQGVTITENVSMIYATSTTVTTTNAFAHVTSATVSAYAASGSGTGNTIGIGVATALGLPLPSNYTAMSVYKTNVDAANEAVGTVDAYAGTIVPTTVPNASHNYHIWFTYSTYI
jgi:hypothetical protein